MQVWTSFEYGNSIAGQPEKISDYGSKDLLMNGTELFCNTIKIFKNP